MSSEKRITSTTPQECPFAPFSNVMSSLYLVIVGCLSPQLLLSFSPRSLSDLPASLMAFLCRFMDHNTRRYMKQRRQMYLYYFSMTQ